MEPRFVVSGFVASIVLSKITAAFAGPASNAMAIRAGARVSNETSVFIFLDLL
jgi:hypothetical protein